MELGPLRPRKDSSLLKLDSRGIPVMLKNARTSLKNIERRVF
jgi:hypothetical protein